MKKTLTIGERIRVARTKAGLSQKALGTALTLSDKAVSAYEVGRAHPSLDILREIGQATGRPLAYFVDDAQTEELDLAAQIRSIEKELTEIKAALKQKGLDV